jgi:acetyl esterase/lipase
MYSFNVQMNCVVHYVNMLAAAASIAFAADAREAARDWASLVGQRFQAQRDVVYRTVAGKPLALDLYAPYDRTPGPAVFYIHGGGWETGSKEQYILWYLPYLELGMRVVAVQYRLSAVAPAPAGAEDCDCAWRWTLRHAREYGIDPERIVITGGSAGGHLALLTAFGGSGFDCPDDVGPRKHPAAVIAYYGPSDLELLYRSGMPSLKRWLRGAEDPAALARRLSPIHLVRKDLPPVLSLHGDADKVVPYAQSVKLHEALTAAQIPNQLVTAPGGAHGRHTWTDADTIRVQRAIEEFLRLHHIVSVERAQ